ncbi:VC0807 family protein [Nonomuraea insulae]|uniref:VC0807 family protein n=1 Tax=Nonomuraea insulae TaxID=1616787 RepID=A0ABW1CC78_9ACTN
MGSGKGKAMLLNWGPTVLLGIVAPFVTYGILTDHGVSEVNALLISGVWPAAETGLYFALKRRVDEFGVMILVLLLLGALSMVAYNSTRLLFIKDSAITGVLGLAFLGSLALPRPLMFHLGRKFGTDGTPAGLARWNGMWELPGFRRAQYRLTVVWGAGFLLEAAVRVVLAFLLPTATMVLLNSVLPLVVVAALVTYTMSVGRRGRARMAAAQAGTADQGVA